MAYGDLKVRNLIWNTGSGDNTIVTSTILTSGWTGTITGSSLTLSGDLTVNGTTTTINTQTLDVEDKDITLGKVSTPSDTTADGGGIILKGASDKYIKWSDTTDAWTSSEHIHLPDNKKLLVGGTYGSNGSHSLELFNDGSSSQLTGDLTTVGSYSVSGASGAKITLADNYILQIGGGTSSGNGKTSIYFDTSGSTYYNIWTSVGIVLFNTSHNFDHQIGGVSHLTIASNLITSKKDHHIEGDLNFVETGTGSNYVGFKAPAAITTDLTWTLPAADGTADQVLSTDGSGTLQWSDGGGGSTEYTAITSNTTATAGSAYLTNTTSASFTVTLPTSPSAGDTVVVADAGGTWATNALTVARNGQNIMASASNLTCNVNGAVVSLIYSGVTANGWIATPN